MGWDANYGGGGGWDGPGYITNRIMPKNVPVQAPYAPFQIDPNQVMMDLFAGSNWGVSPIMQQNTMYSPLITQQSRALQ